MTTEVEDQNGDKIIVKVLETAGGTPSVVEHDKEILTRHWGNGRYYPAQ